MSYFIPLKMEWHREKCKLYDSIRWIDIRYSFHFFALILFEKTFQRIGAVFKVLVFRKLGVIDQLGYKQVLVE